MCTEGQGQVSGGCGDGSPLANISRRIVGLHKDFYGKGPTKAKTYLHDDLVVVLMRGGFTKVEQTLLEQGRGDSVLQQRADFQEVMVDRFKQVVEEETGRRVAALMSASHQHPDLICATFVLATTDLLEEDKGDQPGPVADG
jgi:uncharacterized protein YbcI